MLFGTKITYNADNRLVFVNIYCAEGKYADLAVLSDDYLTATEPKLRKIESVLTLLGGKVVHAAAPFDKLAG